MPSDKLTVLPSDKLTVLVVEDNRPDAVLIRRNLQVQTEPTFEVKIAGRLEQGLAQVDQEGLDVVLLDLDLPDSHGVETLERMLARAPHLPVLVLTGMDDEQLGVAALKAGAQDYLIKGQADSDVLVRAIRYAIQRHALRRELATSHAQQQAILEQTQDGIIIVDEDSVVLYLNPTAEQILGLQEEDVLGQPIGLPISVRQFKEMEVVRPDGHVVAAEKRVAEIEWEGSTAYLASLRDITDRKQHEETRRTLKAKNLVLDELNELNEMKSRFVEVVTHEMRTPMTAVLSSVGLLTDGSLGQVNDSQKKFLQMIARNIDRLSRFTTEVLSLSRLDADKYVLRPRETSLLAAMTPVVELLDTTARQKGISLCLEGADSEPDLEVFADPDAVSQVITNLVSNAMAHCPSETEVVISWQELTNGFVEVLVADNGSGIPEDRLEKIFDRFYQVNRGTGPGYKGSGIGLSICKGLVEKMGGRITVGSTMGAGTTFRFTLPCAGVSEDFLFGKLATNMGYLSDEHLRRSVDLQHVMTGQKRLGKLLQEHGMMTAEEVEHVLQCQDVLLSKPHPRRPARVGESLMGHMAVKYEYLTAEQLYRCVRIQERHNSNGGGSRLGQVLVEQEHLSEEDVVLLLKMQHQDIAVCPECGRKYNTTRSTGQTVTCPNCGTFLEVQKHPRGIEVEGDAV